MIKMKKTKKINLNSSEFISKAKADGMRKKMFNFNLCEQSVKILEELSFYLKADSLSQAVEKILKLFCAVEEEQEKFRMWKETFVFPQVTRVNRTYYLDPEMHDCLINIKRKFKIRYKGEMLRLLLFFYKEKFMSKEEV